MAGEWTDERVDDLKKLWADGISCTGIAGKLGGGITRNAVIGKVHRLGLDMRGGAKADRVRAKVAGRHQQRRKRPTDRTANDHVFSASEAIDLPEDTPTKPVTLLKRKDSECAWPIGDPRSPDFVMCGGDVVKGRPYCTRHCRMAYAAPKQALNITDDERARRSAQAKRINRERQEARV